MKAQEVCEQIIDWLIFDGFLIEVCEKDLKKAIMAIRGVDERTFNRWKNALLIFEYLIQKAPRVYRINPIKTPRIISLLKQRPQTKMRRK